MESAQVAEENFKVGVAAALARYPRVIEADDHEADNGGGWPDLDAAVSPSREVSDDVPALRCVGTWGEIKDARTAWSEGTGQSSDVKPRNGTFADFVKRVPLRDHVRFSEPGQKKNLRTFAPCTLRDYAPCNYDAAGEFTGKKNLFDDNVAAVTVVVFDVDNEDGEIQRPEDIAPRVRELGIACAWYSSPSSTVEKPKFRVVFPIPPVAIENEEDAAVYGEAYCLVGEALRLRFDQSCRNVSRFYYGPAFMCPSQFTPMAAAATANGLTGIVARNAAVKAEHAAWQSERAKKAGAFSGFIEGGYLNFGDFIAYARKKRAAKGRTASAAQSGEAPANRRKVVRVDASQLVTPNIERFFYSCNKLLNIVGAAEAYEGTDPDFWHGRSKKDPNKAHMCCVNNRGECHPDGKGHSKTHFDTGAKEDFYVQNPVGGKGFVISCSHSTCKQLFAKSDGSGQLERIRLLDALCQRWGVKDGEELLEHCFDPEKAREAYDEWGAGFQTDGDGGRPYVNQHNVGVALRKLGVVLSFNVFANRGGIAGYPDHGPQLTDAAINSLRLKIDRDFKMRVQKEFFHDVVTDIARRNSYHPVRDYLDRVQSEWDGVQRVDAFAAKYFGAEDTELNRATGRKWLLAAVRRVRQPGCKFDEIPTLIGPQGGEKSSALATLAAREEWFTDSLDCGAEQKVVIELTRGKWIAELAELSGMSGRDTEKLKAFASRQTDSARAAYGRVTEDVPRAFVMAATSNNRNFLKDRTGNRRFWPIDVGAIDLAALRRDVDQLWGEAAVYEARGEPIRLPRELWDAAAAEQEAHEVENPYLDTLAMKLGDRTGRIAAVDVYKLVDAASPGARHQGVAEGVAKAMTKLGWTKKKVRVDSSRPVQGFVRGDESARLTVVQESDRSWTVEASVARPLATLMGGRG